MDEELLKIAGNQIENENLIFLKKANQFLNELKISQSESDLLLEVLKEYFQTRTVINTLTLVAKLNIKPQQYKKWFNTLQKLKVKKFIYIPDGYNTEIDKVHLNILPELHLIEKISETFLSSPLVPETAFEKFTNFIQNYTMGFFEEDYFFPELKEHIKDVVHEEPKYKLLFKYAKTDLEKAMVSFSIISTLNKNGFMDIFTCSEVLYSSYEKTMEVANKLLNKDMDIVKHKIIIYKKNEENIESFGFPSHIIEKIFGPAYVLNNDEYETIKKEKTRDKELFFNNKMQKNVDIIRKSLKEENLKKILKEFKDINVNEGITMMFYGDPGTGKTELVKKIAYETNRDLYIVNIEAIRGKYVGDSERNAALIFEEYKDLLKKSVNAPILLFNEADAIFNTRGKTESSADQANNSMQNIFLEHLENFEGILIATTNLVENLDNAFDRRFLYKLKFEKPIKEIRMKIWKENLNELSKEMLEKLSKFDISGGDIIKYIKRYIILKTTQKASENDLYELIKNELNNKDKNSIGFLKD